MTLPATRLRLLPIVLLATAAGAQIDLQPAPTTASLRGIDVAGPSVAWASGSGGTILRTANAGATWSLCTVPEGAAKLDFRGIQALDEDTAVIMSSGKGDLSRIYKTTDACKTWKPVFTNPDPEGFFDTVRRVTSRQLYVLGDPVNGRFAIFLSQDAGETWSIADDPGLEATPGDGAFAASNSSFAAIGATLFFGTGGTNLPQVYRTEAACPRSASAVTVEAEHVCPVAWRKQPLPLAAHNAAAGVFSLAARTATSSSGKMTSILVAVGGTYDKPEESTGTAARSLDGGRTWQPATAPPSGYRSAVTFDRETQAWLAAGTSGIDLSRDDGLTWRPLTSSTSGLTANWNAIALPYLVGPKGRIGKLHHDALRSPPGKR